MGLYQRDTTVEPAEGWVWYDSRYALGTVEFPYLNYTKGAFWYGYDPNVSVTQYSNELLPIGHRRHTQLWITRCH